ncbi:L-type lectin-domain containing receptor kinase S.1-like isoform X3 [Populus nigra]|uniref:L-type lectin-domain containing receptor kinase S.1-like isoform X3 n=1 Tax=Populus nigra TaxID=3691 RepID=UPI002B277672|nr:L-type lectin-domain containing receptor kinase S.1-like isoform X3 [Populus nigra]
MLRSPLLLFFFFYPSFGVDFLFNSFNATNPGVTLIPDARVDTSVIRLLNDTNPNSLGRAFYPTKIKMKQTQNSTTTLSSFSTSFVFSILPNIASSPGFGLAFVLSNWTNPPGALTGQYFGLFTNTTVRSAAPLLAVEFDTGQNPEFNDPDRNHIGIDLNNPVSALTMPGGYNSTAGFVPVSMGNGQNVRAWIDFDGPNFQINVTVAPVGVSRPSVPILSFKDPVIANYTSEEMYVGFSASKVTWVEAQRVLAWSFSDTGVARDINVTNLPVFSLPSSSNSLSAGSIAGITIGCVVLFVICVFVVSWFWYKQKLRDSEEDEIEDWELEYWPHRFSYGELSQATNGFSIDQLLGSGGFGKVYRGTLSNNSDIAVKCVNHDSKQGLREFMAEISSMGRLQHKNLVQMRGWCRKASELMLVYDYMPNGSLDRYIFHKPKKLLNWQQRRQVLADVAEGLNYLHHGWEKVVVHRDVKSSNILLDSDMRGRLGDFGLAKLYSHNEVPNTTRVVGTLGYLAPEMATMAIATSASDVYSFGVVILEVVCGRKPVEMGSNEDEDSVLIDVVRDLYATGKVVEAVDERMKGEFVAEEMELVLKLGLVCCHPDSQRRPSMREVVAILVGEDVAAAPAELLNVLASGGRVGDGSNHGGEEVAPTLDEPQAAFGVRWIIC